MIDINDAWYRLSVKALIFNEKGQILLCKEKDGIWDLPGGGLDHAEAPEISLRRELKEEMGLTATHIDSKPKCFITAQKVGSQIRPWIANVCYQTEVENLNFMISNECVEIGFFDMGNVKEISTIANVVEVFKKVF